jgi:DNA-directed RNA polymerase subunit L
MSRFTLQIDDERHGFANMISDTLAELDADRFVASRVPHPLSTFAEVIVDAKDETDARQAFVRACETLISNCDRLLDSLEMSSVEPRLDAVSLPTISLQCVTSE